MLKRGVLFVHPCSNSESLMQNFRGGKGFLWILKLLQSKIIPMWIIDKKNKEKKKKEITRKHCWLFLFVLDLQLWKLLMCPANYSSARNSYRLQRVLDLFSFISSGWPDSHACCNLLWQCNISADSSSTWWLPWYNQRGKFFNCEI